MPPRTLAQLGLLAVGVIVWAAGSRTDNEALTATGVVLFAIAFALRFLKRKQPDDTV